MKAQRLLIHLLSVLLLILWGGVMIYFHVSGRVVNYLPSDGLFRPLMLVGGIGMVVLGLFNLLTYSQDEGACCSHDHGTSHSHDHTHDGCGHEHGHDHAHKHGEGCGHDHDHKHDESCGHDHAHEHKNEGCCGHDHGHEYVHTHAHTHAHTHDHDHDHADHAHGILEEGSWAGRLTAVAILAIPLTLAAVRTPDQFSANAILNKNFYNPNYGTGARKEQFSLQNKLEAAAKAAPKSPAPVVAVSELAKDPTSAPPAGVATASAIMAETAKTPNEKDIPPPAQESKSYGSFTLEDLKAQVPQSKEGNFILEVPELYYTGGDVEVQKVLTGQMVETVAQVLPEKVNNDDGHRVRIFRMLVQCCAADARPYSVPVDFGKKAPEFKDSTWIKVVGKMSYKKEGDQTVPIIEATKVEETTAPDNAMIY